MVVSSALKLPFGTNEFQLRPISLADAEEMLPYFSSEEVCRYIPWTPRNLQGVIEFIEKRCEISNFKTEGDHFVLGACDLERGLVGQVNLVLKSAEHSTADLGYVINPSFQGMGFAAKAASLLMDYAFSVLGIRRITAHIDERNLPSIRVAESLGLRLEARAVEVEFFKGEYVTMLSYAALAKDWVK